MTKEELQEVILINNIPYYLIRNGTTYDYAPIPKEFKIYFDRLQQENNHLKERVAYLERSNNRREETIFYEREENFDLSCKIDTAIEDITFCINGMKNEYACTDSRTNRELHTMVTLLESTIKMLRGNE